MERKPWFQKLAGLFGAKATNTVKYQAIEPARSRQRPELVRRSKHHFGRDVGGVQRTLERQQRPGRLAWIQESVRQGLELRKAFRTKQLIKREIRVKLRAAAQESQLILSDGAGELPTPFCRV
jgi:hypothetical protein